MSNRKQELDRAIKDSVTPLMVKQYNKPEVYNKPAYTVVRHTFADAIGKAQAEALRKQFGL